MHQLKDTLFLVLCTKEKTMKKLVVLVLAGLMLASVAGAQDDGINSLGMYFDPLYSGANDMFEFTGAPGFMTVHIVLKNADVPALFGYEFSVAQTGAVMVNDLGLTFVGSGPINAGGDDPYNAIVGLSGPLPVDPAGTRIASWNFIHGSPAPIMLWLKGATPNSVLGSNLPALLLAGDAIITAGVSAGVDEMGVINPCASINAPPGIVATDEASWD
jgi:hypothetical protein